jgi:[ribosomal protein S5]-alanine N-acetyltransferase
MPTEQPTLLTERLRLRPFSLADAPEVQRLAGDRAIADTTLNVPHPYPDGAAEAWIETHAGGFAAGRQATFAITLRDGGALVGSIGLVIDARSGRAELG